MNKILLGALLFFLPLFSLAGNGDTMIVRSHSRVHMNWNGNYDQKVFFPTAGKTYQRVKMHYTLGCPDKGCSEWDYTVLASLRQPTGNMDSTLRTAPNFKANGATPDSFLYNMDTVYSYFYNAMLPGIDSSADMPVQLILFSDAQKPNKATDTLEVWNAMRYRPVYDMNGAQTDSILIANDQIIYKMPHQWYQVFEVINNLELGRLITPYAADKDKTWEFTYTYDITEFALLLKDSVTVRSRFSGYQDGFTCTIDFEFVEGEPALKCVDIIPLWDGAFPYGEKKGIEEYLVEKDYTYAKTANSRVKLRVIQTGHGFGGNENCAEFCAKDHYVKVNGDQKYKTRVWKDNCGSNAIYPQPGTWIYDRSNWCPGEAITPYEYWIDQYMVDGANTIDLDMQPFTDINNNNNSYIISGLLFVYEENPDAIVDIALEDIIAPSSKNNFVRFNPTCGLPKVLVKNTSMKKVETIVFKYGVKGGNMISWGWNGEILPYESKEIELAYPDWTGASTGEFVVEIESVNGTADGNAFNNKRESQFELTPEYPDEIQIWFKANNKGSETTLSVHQLDGRVIWSRDNFTSGALTKDTVRFVEGCYYFKVTDEARNGFKFWANNDGTGSLTLRHNTGQLIKVIDGDFGTSYIQHFTVGHPLGMETATLAPSLKVYPNPSKGSFTLEFEAQGSGTIRIVDIQGKTVQLKAFEGQGLMQEEWNLHVLSGVYFVEYSGPNGRIIEKVIID